MSKLAIIAVGALMTAVYAQTPPTTPTTGANTTGTSNAGATVPEQRHPTRSAKPTTSAKPSKKSSRHRKQQEKVKP